MPALLFDSRYLLNEKNGLSVDAHYMLTRAIECGYNISLLIHRRKFNALKAIFPQLNVISYGSFMSSIFLSQFRPLEIDGEFDFIYFSQVHPVKFKFPETTTIYQRIHDVFPISNPEWFTIKNRISFRIGFKSINENSIILTNSLFTKFEFAKFIKRSHTYIQIECPTNLKSSIPCKKCESCKDSIDISNFALTVGTLEPRKNYINLSKAWAKINHKSSLKMNLVIIGNTGWKFRKILSEIKSNNKIVLVQNICDHALDRLYSNAKVYIAPSLAEGFDIPANVAKNYKKPIIATDIAVHLEFLSAYNDKLFINSKLQETDINRIIEFIEKRLNLTNKK